jgi:hypothetical protein
MTISSDFSATGRRGAEEPRLAEAATLADSSISLVSRDEGSVSGSCRPGVYRAP